MPNLNAQPSGYIPAGRPEAGLADALSKTTWIDLYIDLWRQVNGEAAPIQDVLADAYARLSVLEANGIRDRGTIQRAATAWRQYKAGRFGKLAVDAPAPAPAIAPDTTCYVCKTADVNAKSLAGAYGMCRTCYERWQGVRFGQ